MAAIATQEASRQRLLYPVGELAEKLGGLGLTCTWELIRRGEFDPGVVRCGRRVFVTDAALRAYIARQAANYDRAQSS
jgi:hypothetical protein